jgi:hypothetical protein
MRIFHGTCEIVPAGAGFEAWPVTPKTAPDAETVTGWWYSFDDTETGYFGAYDTEEDARYFAWDHAAALYGIAKE